MVMDISTYCVGLEDLLDKNNLKQLSKTTVNK
jgi:hypothetical protein